MPRLWIDEERGARGEIAPGIVGAVQVFDHAVDLAAHQRQRGLTSRPVIARSARPLQNLAGIAVKPDVKPTRQADSSEGGILGEEVPEMIEQTIVIGVS